MAKKRAAAARGAEHQDHTRAEPLFQLRIPGSSALTIRRSSWEHCGVEEPIIRMAAERRYAFSAGFHRAAWRQPVG